MKRKMKNWIVIIVVICGVILFTFNMVKNEEISLADVAIEIFASFAGFGLALLADAISDGIKENNERIQLLSNIKDEMIKVKTDINEIQQNLCWINPIKTPYLKSSIHTQKIALLSKSPYELIHKQLLDLEDLIDDYNAWHNLLTQGIVYSGNNSINITDNILLIKDRICLSIDLLIVDFNKLLKKLV